RPSRIPLTRHIVSHNSGCGILQGETLGSPVARLFFIQRAYQNERHTSLKIEALPCPPRLSNDTIP
ncbi:MAG: hypothetical protein ACYC1A_09635, partial [Spirochaetales bacterium]